MPLRERSGDERSYEQGNARATRWSTYVAGPLRRLAHAVHRIVVASGALIEAGVPQVGQVAEKDALERKPKG